MVTRWSRIGVLTALGGCHLALGLQDRQLSPCFDGVLTSPGETDVDCGAGCTHRCEEGRNCNTATDCASGVCGATKRCRPSHCSDGKKTPGKGETDVDCGGPCDGCANGKVCTDNDDCASGICHTDNKCGVEVVVTRGGTMTGIGIVESNPEGMSCDPLGSVCKGRFSPGMVKLVPKPGPNAVFAGWSNTCGLGECTIDPVKEQQLTAIFFASYSGAATFGGPGLDEATGVALVGPQLHITGSVSGDGTDTAKASWWQSDGSQTQEVTVGLNDAVVTRYDNTMSVFGQVQRLHYGGPSGRAVSTAVAVLEDSTRVVVGRFTDTLGSLTSSGGSDMFAMRIDAAGTVLFARAIGGSGDDGATSVSVGVMGNETAIYLGGTVQGLVSLTTSNGNTTIGNAAAGSTSPAVVRLDKNLAIVAATGAADNASLRALAFDPATWNVITTGSYAGSLTLANKSLAASTSKDAFVVSLAADLSSAAWSTRFGNSMGRDAGLALTLIDGDPIVAGSFAGTTMIGNHPVSAIGGEKDEDLFVTRLDTSDGTPKWAYRYGTLTHDRAYAIAWDAANARLLMTGALAGEFDDKENLTQGGDIWIGALGAGGAALWSYRLGGKGKERGLAITPYPGGTIFLTGSLDAAEPFRFASETAPPTTFGQTDGFILYFY
jgi:hypothetical protein